MFSLPKHATRTFLLASGTLALSAVSVAATPHPKFANDLDTARSNAGQVQVIVQYAKSPDTSAETKLSNLGALVRGRIHQSAISATVPSSSLDELERDANVTHISVDHTLGARGSNTAASISTSGEYTAEPINAPQVWSQGYYGANIGVAVIDSGINVGNDVASAPAALGALSGGFTTAFRNRVVYSQSFVPNETNITTDAYGHGTHVAGLIAGNGTNSTGNKYFRTFTGIAPQANLINLRVLDENGAGSDSSVIAAIEKAIALKSIYNIRIINLSLGRPIYESYALDPLCQEVEKAWKAGIVVVVAAGNNGRNLSLNTEGYGTVEAPGNDPYVLTVGAVRTVGTPTITDDAMASYSSKGPSFLDWVAKPDIVAPGNLVTSDIVGSPNLQVNNPQFYTPLSFYQTNGNGSKASTDYMPLSGTSMATGVVSGAVALLLNAQTALTPDQVKAFLMSSANHSVLPQTSTVTDSTTGMVYTDHNDAFTQGAGYLDVQATLTAVKNYSGPLPTGTAMSPIASYDPNSANVTLVTDQTALWGSTALWGASNVYGAGAFNSANTALWGATALWGSTALWGANDPAGFTALWGATALWGSSSPQAATALWGASTGTSSSTALWGSNTSTGSTALWGSSIPYEK